MADNNLDPELIRKANEGIELTAAQQQKLGKSAGKAAKDTEALGKAAGDASAVLGTFLSQIYKGQQGARIFTQTLSGSAQLAGTLGKNGKLAGAAKALAGGLLGLADLSADMSDKLFQSFQNLSRVGAVGADGLTGVFDQLQNFRLSLEDLGQLTQLIGQNAQSLALFGSTVQAGAKSLGALRKFVTGSGLEQEFMALGMNTQEINEAMAGYVNTQVMTGRIQTMNTNQLVAGTEAYVKQMDELTKLTGVSRKEAEAQIEANMRNERFAGAVEKVRREQGDVAAENMRRNMAVLSQMFPETAEGLKDISGGFVNTEAAQKATLSGFGGVAQMLTGDLGPALNTLSQAAKRNTTGIGASLSQVGAFGPTYGAFNEQLKIAGLSAVDMAKAQEQARQEQDKQIKDPEAAVKAQIALRTAQMDTMQNMQSFVNIGVVPATQALVIFAQELHKTSRMLPGGEPMGGGPMDSSVGAGAAAGARSTDVLPGSGNAATGDPVIDAMSGATGNMGGLGIQQRIIGGALGAASNLFRQLGVGGGPEINPDDVINFRSGSGSRQHFDQLQPQVRERALAMAQAYKYGSGFSKGTGQKLNLNSAFRSAEEQAALAASGGQGRNPIAEPGQSLHQEGRALDFNVEDVNYLERMGLLQKYGFKRGYAGGPHISMQDGGIAAGPKSGYNAMLHGTEAVVPLPDGKTIPVTMPEMTNQMNMMTEQITRLDELVALMRNANGISSRILQASTN